MTRARLASIAILLAVACRDGTGPAPRPSAQSPDFSYGPDTKPLATVRWNDITRQLVSTPPFVIPRATNATRAYALVSVAQYAAVLAAKGRDERSAAVAGASAVVLGYLFPTQTSFLEARVVEGRQGNFEAGEALGRAVGEQIIARARTDGSDAVVTLTIPVGPQYWVGTPVTPQWPTVRPWLMSSGSALRPPPPPAFGSPEFLAALAEVKAASDLADADPVRIEQLRTVKFWEDPVAASHHSGHWNAIATDMIVAHRFNELRAARTLALENMAIADAAIACMDAKYFYWLVRPYQADPTIKTPIGQPPHASYPSLHSCQTGAAAGVLKATFPDEAERLATMEQEMNLSRIYAGLHYRFDVETGLDMGHRAARLALATRGKRDFLDLLR